MWPKFESLDKLVLEEWPWFDSLDTEVRELWKVSFELRWVSFALHRGEEDKLEKSNSISTTWLVKLVKMIISVVPPLPVPCPSSSSGRR